nr:hypothetical protein [Spiroplasma sp. Moj]
MSSVIASSIVVAIVFSLSSLPLLVQTSNVNLVFVSFILISHNWKFWYWLRVRLVWFRVLINFLIACNIVVLFN